MTSLEELKQEMILRGAKANQVNGKTVAMVLDILSNSNSINTNEWESEQKVKRLEERKSQINKEIERLNEEAKKARELKDTELRNVYKNIEERERGIQDMIQYCKDLKQSIEQCETEEGREKVRLAQVFRNSVNVGIGVADSAAYVLGLAMLLTGCDLRGGVNALKEIDPDIFKSKNWVQVRL